MKKLNFIARTLRGVEAIAASEIRRNFPDASPVIGHREVRFEAAFSTPEAFQLKTIDDLLILHKEIKGIDHTRNSISLLETAFLPIDIEALLSYVSKVRKLPSPLPFTVVASFLGKRNYNRFEIEDIIGKKLAESFRGIYQSSKLGKENPPALTFRVHLWDDKGWLGLRLFETPLHRRDYKTTSRTGSLHPPLAHAMAFLANIEPGQKVIDPFCGVGTIPIEAKSSCPEAEVYGLDFEDEPLNNAQQNATQARVKNTFQQSDAGSLPFADQSIDRIVSNIPWNHQVDAAGDLRRGLAPFWREVNRVLTFEGKAVLLTHDQEEELWRLEEFGLELLAKYEVSLFGKHPEIWVLGRVW
jgi:tRNA (guanine6-N2)-methyltransferase